MKVESRYVEYSGGKRVVEGKWFLMSPLKCPKGCMDVGMSERDARRMAKRFERGDLKRGCSNFEYRVAV